MNEKMTMQNSRAEELELTDAQANRNDEIYGTVFELCQLLTENPNLEWDMEFIGEIADFAANLLTEHGFKVRFPSVVTEQNGKQYIEEYYK